MSPQPIRETAIQWGPNPNYDKITVEIAPSTVAFHELGIGDRFLLTTGLGTFMPEPKRGQAYPLIKVGKQTASHVHHSIVVIVPEETQVYPDKSSTTKEDETVDHFASNIRTPSESQLQDLLEKLFINQNTLNIKAYDAAWVERALAGDFDYPLAAGFEIIEFGNSWNKWNWWTKADSISTYHKLNMCVELVDALHFIASDLLVQFNGDVTTAYNECATHLAAVHRTFPVFKSDKEETRYITSRIKSLMVYAGTAASRELDPQRAVQALVSLYQLAIHACGLDFSKFFTMYMAKSALNQFRQDNGYRQKQYTKVWAVKGGQDIEDNHMLMMFVANSDVLPKTEAIMAWLTDEYAKVKAAQEPKQGQQA